MCNIAQASEEKGIEKGREEEFIVAESQIFKL